MSDAESAVLPFTIITAYELLFEYLTIKKQAPDVDEKFAEVILEIGAADGVGSILIQLVRAITGATIIATPSRESSQAWVKKLGAHYVVDHSKPLVRQINTIKNRASLPYRESK